MKIILILFLTMGYLGTVSAKDMYIGLFATVINLVENDTLRVRENPDYHAKKIGALPIDAYVGVGICKEVRHATWCEVHHVALRDYADFGYDAKPGWVNARYLKFINNGYVIIDKKPNCDYALKCIEEMCEVVTDYTMDTASNIVSLTIKKIKRERLHTESNFGAMEENADGYCTSGGMIEYYLTQKRTHELLKEDNDGIKKRLIDIVDVLGRVKYGDAQEFIFYIHPLKGITMTWNVRFGGKEDMHFGYSDIKHIEKNRYQKIDWGQTYGKGDDVFMSLYDYMNSLSLSVSDITKIETLKDLKGFKCHARSECKGYEVFWINNTSETKEYDWLGLVIILEKYKDIWYVVGLLRDRWTI